MQFYEALEPIQSLNDDVFLIKYSLHVIIHTGREELELVLGLGEGMDLTSSTVPYLNLLAIKISSMVR